MGYGFQRNGPSPRENQENEQSENPGRRNGSATCANSSRRDETLGNPEKASSSFLGLSFE
jgi:hypothetical protein